MIDNERNRTTTMCVERSVLDKLRVYKIHPRESDNECLSKVLDRLSKLSDRKVTNEVTRLGI